MCPSTCIVRPFKRVAEELAEELCLGGEDRATATAFTLNTLLFAITPGSVVQAEKEGNRL